MAKCMVRWDGGGEVGVYRPKYVSNHYSKWVQIQHILYIEHSSNIPTFTFSKRCVSDLLMDLELRKVESTGWKMLIFNAK